MGGRKRMTIVCTKEQKRSFIYQAESKTFCPFMADGMIDCCNDCKSCIEKNVNWEITNETAD